MSTSANPDPSQSPGIGVEFTRDTTLEVLSNQRRRFTIHFLKQQPGNRAAISDLAECVAGWENDKRLDELDHQERKRVRNALQQFHLPKMAEEGFVEYDREQGVVALTDAASSANFYVDSLTGGDVPWGIYYLGLSALSLVCLAGLWFEVQPFTAISPSMYCVYLVAALVVSSVGHFYDNYYRMRLGAREEPPEVGDE
ncbi:MAG: hypothetical protein V5A41_15330 [Haloarculaceae archaeon]